MKEKKSWWERYSEYRQKKMILFFLIFVVAMLMTAINLLLQYFNVKNPFD